ncbi:Thiol:disulfide interchange protein DsbD [uncultured archaeon]|nr:Thiol:disulfide interchange protein DsbD [uncultured archaeon]
MAENVSELSAKQFEEFTKSGLVFIDFFAEWCMPCVMMAPVVEEISEKFKNKIKFGKINVGENEALAKKFNVSSIPHFILFKNGKKVEEFTGAMDAEELESRLKKLI